MSSNILYLREFMIKISISVSCYWVCNSISESVYDLSITNSRIKLSNLDTCYFPKEAVKIQRKFVPKWYLINIRGMQIKKIPITQLSVDKLKVILNKHMSEYTNWEKEFICPGWLEPIQEFVISLRMPFPVSQKKWSLLYGTTASRTKYSSPTAVTLPDISPPVNHASEVNFSD